MVFYHFSNNVDFGKKFVIFANCIQCPPSESKQTRCGRLLNGICMSENKILKVGITQGDFNGIGPEVIIKTLADSRMTELATPVIYGSSKAFSFYRKGIGESEGFSFQIVTACRTRGAQGEDKPRRNRQCRDES